MNHLKNRVLKFCSTALVLFAAYVVGGVLASVSVTGCAALPGILHTIDSAITDSDQALKIVETTFNLYEGDHPVSPAVKATFEKLLAEAYAKLKLGAQAVHDGQDMSQGKYDTAFADFKTAFLSLTSYLKSEGITPIGAGLIGVGPNGGQDFPEPAVIGLRIKQ